MSRVLVTGASGFIGRHTIAQLVREGHEVHAVLRRVPTRLASHEVSWHELDLLEAQSVARFVRDLRPEQLLHLAWYAEHGRFWSSTENLRWVEGSLAMLRAFTESGGRRVVIAGTCAEYDWKALALSAEGPGLRGAVPLCREGETPIAPNTLYGVSKHALHMVAESYLRQVGVDLAWGRLFYLYGPYEQPGRLVPAVAASLLSEAPTPTSDGRQIRDFMYVKDAAQAFVALLNSGVVGAVNIASGEPLKVADLVARIAALTGHAEMLEWGAVERAPEDPPVLVADVARLRDEVKFTPVVRLDAGLESTIAWQREHLDG